MYIYIYEPEASVYFAQRQKTKKLILILYKPPKIARPIGSRHISGAQTLLRSPKYGARCYVMLLCHIAF